MTKTAIGIDIGGTKISIAVGDNHGRILAYKVMPTLKGSQTQESVKQLVAETRRMIQSLSGASKKKLLGIGVCLPGAVDSQRGIVPHSPNLPGWKGLKLAGILSREFRLPVRMVNDANAAAVGEMLFGAARGIKNFVYVTVSTGVGGGIVIDGRLLEGARFVAGEIGHMTIVADGDLCSCGRRGCFEAYASGGSIERYTTAAMKKKKIPGLARFLKNGRVSARAIKGAAHAGNPFAVKAFQRAGHYLGIGLGSLLNVLNPEKIVLGGGVLEAAPQVFWKAMRLSLKATAWPEAYKSAKLVRTPLKKNVGNLGALAVVFNANPKSKK